MSSQKAFWKIDLKEVYQQIDLHKHSIKVTNFHRENDVYRFKQLCYHINNSFENVNVNKLFGALYLSIEIYTKLIYKIALRKLLNKTSILCETLSANINLII